MGGNFIKHKMNLRKHQREFQDIINDIIVNGSHINKIECECTPGSGKSLLPIMAGKLIEAGLADALIWIVPRLTLAYQAEENFTDIKFRKFLNHALLIRVATNDNNPCRGLQGFVTTYQAISVDGRKTVLSDFLRKKYILILDENQHVEEGGIWHEALQPIADKAKYVVLMSGTAYRGNMAEIAFMNGNPNTTAKIKYTRKDALAEKAIIPLQFSFSDGSARWIDHDGQEKEYASIADVPRKDVGKAIYTAISTGYAEDLLSKGLSHWANHKKRHPGSKLLVVTANVALAKKAVSYLRGRYKVSTEIATSHESAAAQIAIKQFKAGATDILVGVAMFYEGFDCKQVSHIISLTHIRSQPWLVQMFARAVRIDPDAGAYETQCGYVFAPDDPILRKIVAMVESEQAPFLKKHVPQTQGTLFGDDETDPLEGGNMYGILPVSSTMTGNGQKIILGTPPIPSALPMTPSEIEAFLRKQIEGHINHFSRRNRHNPKRINSEIKQYFGKPRDIMTAPELEATLAYIQKAYPIDGSAAMTSTIMPYHARVRGSGKRVSTKATAWAGVPI